MAEKVARWGDPTCEGVLVRGLQRNRKMNRFGKHLGRAALALGLSLVATACSAPTAPDASSSDEDLSSVNTDTTVTKTPRPTTPATKPPPPVKPAGTAPPPANACAQQVGQHACFDCCNQASGGALAISDEVFDQCACGTGGACTAVCDANYCSNGQTTAACEACLTATCEPLENSQCTTAACKAGLQCMDECP